MKRKRYAEGWIVDYPKGSAWRERREELKDLARGRRVTLGVVMLEAIESYLARELPACPPAPRPPKKKPG